ncbi:MULTISPECIES: methyltransferase [unclassified Modicisalibacter]|uniref:methyltransferase n=1 Tax=unclassified Modicisalibacter TaxID=2679913 RepID=UPI001CCDED5B|nr:MULTISPECIES: methyltransferase [unclassified Modicisalibacter]MBZ9558526.1 hypothetical protein [Modicisalibacter sp. R2A 31.J]MBZ9575582.1 hypothetical protein [Modicisalibacter sp. MOD 31.J]
MDDRPPLKLMQQISAYRTSQCIHTAVELDIPAHLSQGPQTASELARAAAIEEGLLSRLMDHLVNEDIFARDESGRYGLTEASRFLLPESTNSLHPWVECELHPLYWLAWTHLTEQLRSGTPAFELAHGRTFFDYLSQDKMARKRFDAEMRAASLGMGHFVAQQLDFPEGTTVVDVGGGDGSFLAQVLKRNPGTKGILFELPRTDDEFHPDMTDMIRNRRAIVEYGSFFEFLPPGGDAYIFSRVFHDFDDAAISQVLEKARATMRTQARLFIIDMILEQTRENPGKSSQDMVMMLLLGGRERTQEEFCQMLAKEGFECISTIPTNTPLRILEFRNGDINGAPAT